ncbi:MAG TPA: hypothetical protein VFL71_01725 [Actinomycetes bacterium]|nr:hypothetical protein [Actinomycetes bacterium]
MPRTSWRDDMVTAALCAWVVTGMVLDAWAHQNASRLETFFTPWHAVLYSGFAVLMAWMVARTLAATGRRRERAAVPVGYGLGLVGVVLFLVSGVGDGIWHTVFGVEREVEAALSPTHIGLFVGALLVFTTPLRAAWSSDRPGAAPSLRALLPALLSLTFATVLVSFLFFYLSAFRDPASTRPFERWAGQFPGGFPSLSYTRQHGVASVLVTNLLLVAPVLLLLRRWRPPFGSATLLLTAVAVLTTATQEFAHGELVAAAAAGGLAADWSIARWSGGAGAPGAHRLVATVTPLALWTSYFLVLQLTDGIAWPAELWTGSVVFASLSGLALSLLMAPPTPGTAMDDLEAEGLARREA